MADRIVIQRTTAELQREAYGVELYPPNGAIQAHVDEDCVLWWLVHRRLEETAGTAPTFMDRLLQAEREALDWLEIHGEPEVIYPDEEWEWDDTEDWRAGSW